MIPSRLWPRLALLICLAVIGIGGFSALGIWQLQRLHWKRDLIARVESRVHAAPLPAPRAEAWPAITTEADEYRRVRLTGQFLQGADVLIYTPSDYGPADWVLTPLQRDDGSLVMINRGLVPDDLARAGAYAAQTGNVTVTGLLRISEDKGWLFSRANASATGHWYRRDIASITSAKRYTPAAPYFIDEEMGSPTTWPRGGQTVIHFRNAHLSYALTWFALAVVVLAGLILALRQLRSNLTDLDVESAAKFMDSKGSIGDHKTARSAQL